MRINIAIDGPSAAGKSSLADCLAEKLGYVHLNTGSMYRCTAYKALQKEISLDDEDALCAMLAETEMEMKPDGTVLLDGQDVTHALREGEISQAASRVSRLPRVRADLVARQQKMAKAKGYILDGRDIGTVVLKDAELKIFLTASAHARALRRAAQNRKEGIEEVDLDAIEKAIEERDFADSHRAASPLKKAEDAIVIDNSDLTLEETTNRILDLARERIAKGEAA